MTDLLPKVAYYKNILKKKKDRQEKLLPEEVNHLKLCRICFTDCEDATDIGNMRFLDHGGKFVSITDMIFLTTGNLIRREDGVPMRICKECFVKIRSIYDFQKQVNRSCIVFNRLSAKLAADNPYYDIIERMPDKEDLIKFFNERRCNQLEDLKIKSLKNPVNNEADELRPKRLVNEVVLDEIPQNPSISYHADSGVQLRDDDADYVNPSLSHQHDYDDNINADAIEFDVEILDEYRINKDGTVEMANGKNEEHQKESNPRSSSRSLLSDFTCVICEKTFLKQRHLIDHVQKHHPSSKAFKCRLCDRMFAHVQSLSRHMLSHRGRSDRLICEICHKQFLRSDDYTRHMRTHTGERPYACKQCTKAFKQISELKEHQLCHINTKPFLCNLCSHKFASRNGLYLHMKLHKSGGSNGGHRKRSQTMSQAS